MLHIALWPTCPGLFEDDAPHRFCWGIWRGTPERTKNDLGTRLQTPKTISGTRLGGPKAHCPGTPSSTKNDGADAKHRRARWAPPLPQQPWADYDDDDDDDDDAAGGDDGAAADSDGVPTSSMRN